MAEGAARVVPARTTDVRLTLPQLWVALAILLPVLGALLAGISTVDLAYHLRAGGIVLDTRRLPSPDTFTFTAGGLAWLDQQWGAQALFAALDRAGGWALLATVRAALVGLTSLLVYRGCRMAGAEMRPAAWLTLGGFAVGLVALGLRPQLLAMVLFAATLAILAGRIRRPALVWAIPVLVILWANVHGSFFLGPAAVVVAWLEDRAAGRREWRLLLVAAVSALATLVNPYGPGVWAYAAGLAVDPTIRRLITEWQATAPLSFAGAMFYGSLVAAVAILGLALRRTGDAGGCHPHVRPAQLADAPLARRAGRHRGVCRAGRRVVVDRRPGRARRAARGGGGRPNGSHGRRSRRRDRAGTWRAPCAAERSTGQPCGDGHRRRPGRRRRGAAPGLARR